MRRTAPSMLSPRAKTHNYLNMIVAEKPVKALNPDAWAILLDEHGNLAEGLGSNIFIVREGALFTPSERYVLPGVSRQMTIDCAKKLGIDCTAGDIDLFDAANAEEMFLTSTSLCILPVRSFNGAPGAESAASLNTRVGIVSNTPFWASSSVVVSSSCTEATPTTARHWLPPVSSEMSGMTSATPAAQHTGSTVSTAYRLILPSL